MQVHILSTVEEIKAMVEHVDSSDYDLMAIDVETDSVQEKIAKLYGIGIAFKEDEAFYIPIRDKEGNETFKPKTIERLKETLLRWSKEKKLIGHNIIYDVLVLENNWNLLLTDHVYADTILMKHAVDEERPHGLKETAIKYLGSWADKAQQNLLDNIKVNGGTVTKDNMQMFKADTEVLGEYCGWDVMLTVMLYNKFMPMIEADNGLDLFFDETMPLYRLGTIEMKRTGFTVDVPYFENLLVDIEKETEQFKANIYKAIKDDVKDFEDQLLDEEYPAKPTGSFAKEAANYYGVRLPEKDGKVSMVKKGIEAIRTDNVFFSWYLDGQLLDPLDVKAIQRALYCEKNETSYVFNINSNDHLIYLFYTKYGLEPEEKTETGKPKMNKDALEDMTTSHPFVSMILDYKKLMKLKSTYIEGLMDKKLGDKIYPSFLQFGTTSGRYSCTNYNLQNLPRLKDDESKLSPLVLKYVNAIKKGFIAPKGYKIVNADVDSLEPTCFAAVSEDPKLQDVFLKKTDLYSSVAINVFGLENYSADKKDPRYLKNHRPEYRQQAKTFCFSADTIMDIQGKGYSHISDVKKDDLVWTKHGYKKVSNVFKRTTEAILVVSEKRAFKCTPDHKFWCPKDQKFKEIIDFRLNDELELGPLNVFDINAEKPYNEAKFYEKITKDVSANLSEFDVCRLAVDAFSPLTAPDTIFDYFSFLSGVQLIDFLNLPEHLRLAAFLSGIYVNKMMFRLSSSYDTDSVYKMNILSMLGETLGVNVSFSSDQSTFSEAYIYTIDNKDKARISELIDKHNFPDFKLFRKFRERIKDPKSNYGSFTNPTTCKIITMKNIGKQYVYDITVDEVHEFYANGVRVHNCLAVVYGAEAGRISKLMNTSYQEADAIIHKYMDAYPKLKDYLSSCTKSVLEDGKVTTIFGRTRHLPEAKRLYATYGDKLLDPVWCRKTGKNDLRWKLKGMLNLAKNHPIQGLASHIINRAIIAVATRFKDLSIDGKLIACVHDELTYIVREDQAAEAAKILKDCIENTTKIAVPLSTTPLIADNWAEAK